MANFKDVEVFGLEAKVVDYRISENPDGFDYKYDMRHNDSNWVDPVTIEKRVMVNFCGSIFFKKELMFSNDCRDYIELHEDDVYNIIQALN